MEKQLFELIMAVKKKCLHTEERIRSNLKLSPGEFHGLLVLVPGETLPARIFTERMSFSASRGSRIINRLVQRQYLTIEIAAEDRRSIRISLTDEGVRMREIVFENMTECENKIKAHLSESEIADIRKALILLTGVM